MIQNRKEHVFCENVKALRMEHQLSKRKMAQIMGVGILTLNQLEQGILPQRLKASVLLRLADHFDCSTDELFFQRYGRGDS